MIDQAQSSSISPKNSVTHFLKMKEQELVKVVVIPQLI
ncbi:hypothetical protein SeseC_02356 [Streptococcus equi subsp. zooepidemicus ATCC 35246]|nr:hypothetical protein SeseC_02356 [Streptococcus equi subsp. zooepidemicus ATCC 35246]